MNSEVIYWSKRWRYAKDVCKRFPNCRGIEISDLAMGNYAMLLVEAFNFLFEKRLGRIA